MILVDSGPLVALVDSEDQYHEACLRAFKRVAEPLGTLWPCLVETMYFLSGQPVAQNAVWEMLDEGSVRLLDLGKEEIPRIRSLMRKYEDREMGLVDAALVAVAERDNIDTIFTVDKKDFSIYRPYGRARFKIIP